MTDVKWVAGPAGPAAEIWRGGRWRGNWHHEPIIEHRVVRICRRRRGIIAQAHGRVLADDGRINWAMADCGGGIFSYKNMSK